MGVLLFFLILIAMAISTMGFIANEQFVWAVVVDIALILFGFFILEKRSRKTLKRDYLDADVLDYVQVQHIEGLTIPQNIPCIVARHQDKIVIKSMYPKAKATFEILNDQIKAVELKNEQEFIELDRSVVGRAIVGTLLVPGLGTIVGGLSGLKTRKKKPNRSLYLIINYLNKDGIMQGITFQNDFSILGMNNFVNKTNQMFHSNTAGTAIRL
ncbi:hypothetical protein [Paenibacillus sp. GbtcB18]|uniref:hypothetical protein n=1 Tax=Paenibacillus sp. GbtcB18 TaxID=2824763 RepID=UPI001C2FB555|nr:hypothetical protein [Paenibacillus sp. GbtcB18]